MNDLKVGTKVKCIQTGETGVVVRITECDTIDPVGQHGTVAVKILDPGKCKWLKAGSVEHYSHFGWYGLLEVMTEGQK